MALRWCVAARWTFYSTSTVTPWNGRPGGVWVQVDQKAGNMNRQDVTLAIEKYWRDADAARRQWPVQPDRRGTGGRTGAAPGPGGGKARTCP